MACEIPKSKYNLAKKLIKLPNGAKLATVGLGTWQAKERAELEQALETALEAGYRHIDTAWVYENEKLIGDVLKRWFDAGKLKREDLFITTKLPPVGVHPDRVEHFIQESLKNLQLDYVDLYLIHFPIGFKYTEGSVRPVLNADGKYDFELPTDHVGVWKKLEEQVDKGRTKSIGLSNFNIKQIQKILDVARIKPANLQVELHLYLQQSELVDFCHKNGISVVAYCPLANPGFNKFLESIGQEKIKLPEILSDPLIAKLSAKYSKTPAQIALRFLLQRGVVVIPKSVTPNRIHENFNIYDFVISDDDMVALIKLDVGEAARICDLAMIKGASEHPDFPFGV